MGVAYTVDGKSLPSFPGGSFPPTFFSNSIKTPGNDANAREPNRTAAFHRSLSLITVLLCSKHGRFDTGVSGVQDATRLVLQHRGCSKLQRASITGPELHSVHRGLPASARSLSLGSTLNERRDCRPAAGQIAKLATHILSCLFSLFSVKWVGVGKSRESMIKLF